MNVKIEKGDLFAFLIMLFPICNIIGSKLSYYDEIIGCISFAYVIIMLCKNKLDGYCRKITFTLMLISFLGLVSNFFSGLIDNYFAILVDLLWLWKTFATFIFFFKISEDVKICNRIIRTLTIPAKFVIIILLILSIIGEFVDIGVTSGAPFHGIKPFGFFWHNGIQTGWLIFCCMLILSMTDMPKKTYNKYLICALIPLFLTTSSLVYCWISMVLLLPLLMRKGTKFKVRHIFLVILFVCMFVYADLQTYFLGEASVRKSMIEGGIKVANEYFPLGSGFATYGSEMASRYYSKIYIGFGWRYSWGLGEGSGYLNDNFFASIMGQFGWIGFALYLYALYNLFKSVNKTFNAKRTRILSIATILTIVAVMIGSASAKSMMGVNTFAVLGLVCGHGLQKPAEDKQKDEQEEEQQIEQEVKQIG